MEKKKKETKEEVKKKDVTKKDVAKKDNEPIIEKNDEPNTKNKTEKKIVFILISAIVLVLLGLLVFQFSSEEGNQKNNLDIDSAKIKAEKFINETLMMPGTRASIVEIEENYGLYKIMVDVGMGEIIESYISKDGSLFIPQSIDIAKFEEEFGQSSPAKISEKREKADIELFVMSHCPYSVQMEKGIIPIINLLEDYVNFELKFNSYVMQGEIEIEEQLNQYCIQKEAKSKLLPYLECFALSANSEECLEENDIDKLKIADCSKKADEKYFITEDFEDQSTWLNDMYPKFSIFEEDNEKYWVQGSPALVINEELVSPKRDPQSLLNIICSGLVNPPEECDLELSKNEPSIGFGE
jgi:hypothetical protein